MKKLYLLLSGIVVATTLTFAQDNGPYSLMLNVPVVDLPSSTSLSYTAPSMNQALHVSNALYDLSFYAISRIDQKIFRRKQFARKLTDYVVGLGFSRYASELPIPLGVWAHEEFHRSVLGLSGLHPKNGNWIFTRWDGTVFGITDSQLSDLKRDDPSKLLYSYVAGVQYETLATQENVVDDFFFERTQYKTPMYLYNAWYVWNYFQFSTSALSDSVKLKAPEFESKVASERDFAGADLTAWAYDMFTPGRPYEQGRAAFPDGQGVNRRIGYRDLSADAQHFLLDQKRLALLNFVNPAIFFVNRIKLSDKFSFNAFASYQPTHFGNAIAFNLPMKISNRKLLLVVDRYSNKDSNSYGLEVGSYDYSIGRLSADTKISVWSQPAHQSYYDNSTKTGALVDVKLRMKVGNSISLYANGVAKTEGWVAGSPFLGKNVSMRAGVQWRVRG